MDKIQSVSEHSSKESQKQKLIIDVDTGVDDAQAIMMALAAEDTVQVLAITCVSGNANIDQVCYNTLRVLKVCGRMEVPVFRGAHSALVIPMTNATHIHGSDGMGGVPDLDPPDMSLLQTEHASMAIARLAQLYKDEITLVCLAPLTNIALALRMNPQLASNLRNVVIMGGNIEAKGNVSPTGEFNFHSDPESALIVLENLKCPTQLLCWEPCTQNGIEWDWFDNIVCQVDTPIGKFHKKINEHYTRRKKEVMKVPLYYSCDPAAMAIAIDPSLILESKHVYSMVELKGELTRGQMIVDWNGRLKRKPNTEIITKINMEGVKKLYIQMLQ